MGKVYYRSPVGVLEIITYDGFLTNINMVDFIGNDEPDEPATEVLRQLGAYFDRKLTKFDLPVKLSGNGFCRRVWESMTQIPYGMVVTYGELAAMAGSPKAYRSAGSCAGKNPIPIVIPCHRVVAGSGIGGFSLGLDVKRKLHSIENIDLQNSNNNSTKK